MKDHKGWHSRGYLPHLDAPGVIQAVTFRLSDSLPIEVVERLDHEAEVAKRRHSLDVALDAGHGDCLLAFAQPADIVERCLLERDGPDYRLIAWVIMPNHVHVVAKPLIPLPDILQAWKSVTARRINAWRGCGGRLWQPDYFDRFLRDDAHLAAVIAYVEENPVKAGLCERPEDWRWGSAVRRAGEGARAP
ncbi:transposase [Paramagnetospirillum kuznetsovii]|uniref:Transposase n=1 Tax=Paramagnetospirillum kuznetsovii TaxID=2053833 RepID=A0A364NZI7_9PROT|nr:transposase [Paramagnetospirillum kuznetsovii]RAU22498.1 transposase [Paramagnetospirillum kuznetsovii]